MKMAPIVSVTTAPSIDVKQLKYLAVGSIIVGSLCIVLEVIFFFLGLGDSLYDVGTFSGIWFVILGAVALSLARGPTSCMKILTCVFCIIGALLSLSMVGRYSAQFKEVSDNENSLAVGPYSINYGSDQRNIKIRGILFMSLAMAESVINIWISILCCMGYCCCSPPNETLPVPMLPVGYGGGMPPSQGPQQPVQLQLQQQQPLHPQLQQQQPFHPQLQQQQPVHPQLLQQQPVHPQLPQQQPAQYGQPHLQSTAYPAPYPIQSFVSSAQPPVGYAQPPPSYLTQEEKPKMPNMSDNLSAGQSYERPPPYAPQ